VTHWNLLRGQSTRLNDHNPDCNEREKLMPESIHKTSRPDKEASKKQDSSH